MKILVVADVLGEKNNGTTIATFNLINALKEKGHEVRVLCSDKNKEGEEGYFILPKFNFGILNKYVAKVGVAPMKANKEIFEKALEGVDIVHTMLPFIATGKLVALADKKNIPISSGFNAQAENVTSHLFLMWSKLATRWVYRFFWKHCYRYADCIHYPTQFIKSDFEKRVGPTNGYVISNGINILPPKHIEKSDEYKGKFLILMTGRYCREKRQDLLIRAVKYSKYKDKIQLVFAGCGPTKKKLARLGNKLKNKPILNFFNHEDLINLISQSDLYVHTAYAELESIAALEAMGGGLVPIINNSKRSATRFFAIDEQNLFKENNPKSLAKQIDFWIDNPEANKKRSQEYIEYVKKFEFNHCMDRMEKMLKEAVEVRKYKIENNLHHRLVYYKDPLIDDFAGTNITQKKIDDNFIYINNNKFWRFLATIFYFGIALPILYFFVKIKRHVRVKNRKVLKKIKKQGYFLYGNHTNICDAFTPHTQISRFRKTYIIANPDAVSIRGVKNIVMMLGVLPTPGTALSVKNFNEAIEKRIKQKRSIVIYPEAHIWPFYTGLRPFSDISFQYPVRLNAPSIAMVTTYRKPKFKICKNRRPYIDITLSEPIYPDLELSAKENMKKLRDSVYDFMKQTIEASHSPEYITYLQANPNSTKFEK